MRKQLLLIWLLFCLNQHFGIAQTADGSENNEGQDRKVLLSGYVRGSSFFGGEQYDFADLFSEFRLNTEARFDKAGLKSDIRFRTGMRFGEKTNEIEIKELYGSFQSEKAGLSIGNQIVEWGRTDGYNPTNNLTPKNYFFLSSDMDDQVLSNFMARLKYAVSPAIDVDLVLAPIYRPSTYRFDLIPIGPNVEFKALAQPEFLFGNMGYAARLNFDYPSAGFSFSYFNGYSTFYGFDHKEIIFDQTGSMTIINQAIPYRKQAIGIDFAIPADLVIIRGEAAYNIISDDTAGIFIPMDDLSYVVGLEKEIGGFRFIVQYLGKYTLSFKASAAPDPKDYDLTNPLEQMRFGRDMAGFEMALFNSKLFGQQYEFGHAISGFVSKSFAFDMVTTELAGMYDFQTEEWMVRPKVSWKVNDQVSIGLGGIYLKGPEQSLFYYSKSVMNGFFGDFRVYF